MKYCTASVPMPGGENAKNFDHSGAYRVSLIPAKPGEVEHWLCPNCAKKFPVLVLGSKDIIRGRN